MARGGFRSAPFSCARMAARVLPLRRCGADAPDRALRAHMNNGGGIPAIRPVRAPATARPHRRRCHVAPRKVYRAGRLTLSCFASPGEWCRRVSCCFY